MDQPPSQPRDNKPMIDIPIISTTISSILHASQSDPDKPTDEKPHAPAGLASYLPAAVTPMFFRKSTAKPAARPARAGARSLSPSKSFTSFEQSSICSETDSRQSQETTKTDRGRKRSNRPKSSYSICYAPPRPGNFNKIKVRARPLLQLHKIESRARPRPELELIPSAIFSTRLKKAAANFSSSKHNIGPSDLALVRAEKYHEHEESLVEVDESKDLLAIISGVAKGRRTAKDAKVFVEGGVAWDAYRLPNGSYECVTTDSHGLKRTVRWVAKKDKTASDEAPSGKKFNFSTILPGTRRHPIIANLSHDGLEVSDTYTIPSPSSPPDSPTPTLVRNSSDQSITPDESLVVTTVEQRNLIAATAIFVALNEGWCPGYGGADDVLSRSSSMRSCTSPGAPPRRTTSFDSDSLRGAGSMRQALRSPSFLRSNSVKYDSRPSSPASSLTLDEKSVQPIPESPRRSSTLPHLSPRRPRADTVATVIVNSPSHSDWTPVREDETEDEAEEEEGEAHPHIAQTSIEFEHSSGAATLVDIDERAASRQEKRTSPTTNNTNTNNKDTQQEDKSKAKKLSTASTAVSESPRPGKTELSEKPMKKKKGGFRRFLLCGSA